MKKILIIIIKFIQKSDMLLLFISILCSIIGIILISSATKNYETHQYVYTQGAALVIGIFLYILFSAIDIDIIADKSKFLFVFSILFISTLFIWGEAGESGNRAWLRFFGSGIQPAEVVKIPFIIILARQMVYLKERKGLSAPLSILQLVIYFGIIFGLIIVSSSDLGSALVYFFVFAVVLFIGGVKLRWFVGGAALLSAVMPIIWIKFLTEKQKLRILAPYDLSIDPSGLGIKWQPNQSKIAIASGQFTGKGLYQGSITQASGVPQQHTDFVFAVAGEELGFIGCMIIILLLLALIIRCIQVGLKSNSTLGMLICTGIASMLVCQMVENIGMCLGLMPVIGLTLPFFSYGGSSLITNFAALGIVSGIKMRPKPISFRRR